jgi:hypothetical protein
MVKEGEFWQWTKVETVNDLDANKEKPVAAPTNTYVKSSYETAEERKWKQRLIVRQATLNAAIATLKTDKSVLASEAVKSVAEQYENWVYRNTETQQTINESTDVVE